MELVLIQELRQFHYSTVISPFLLFEFICNLGCQSCWWWWLCALVPSLWRCSQSMHSGEMFFSHLSEKKKQASCKFLFKLMWLSLISSFLTASTFPALLATEDPVQVPTTAATSCWHFAWDVWSSPRNPRKHATITCRVSLDAWLGHFPFA